MERVLSSTASHICLGKVQQGESFSVWRTWLFNHGQVDSSSLLRATLDADKVEIRGGLGCQIRPFWDCCKQSYTRIIDEPYLTPR